jgi:RNA polymerase sigma-70 factor (family 1)
LIELQDDIILAFRQGERSAFEAIYGQLYDPIITFCKYLVTAEDAEDITSEVFFGLWKSREKWDSIINIRAFLYVSARNRCLDLIKHKKLKTEKQKEIAFLYQREQELVLQSEMESDLITRIKQEIDNLPDRCKEVFTMSFIEGYKNPEIAEKLSISSQTVKNLKVTALKALRITFLKKDLQVNMITVLIQFVWRHL